jgi:phosphoribosylglycinamide formyltransferase 1
VPSSAPTGPMRLAVLISGSGTNLAALLARIDADPGFGGEVVVVGSDRPEAAGLDLARRAGLPVVAEPLGAFPDRDAWEADLRRGLELHRPDAVILAGFMRVLSGSFLSAWPGRVLNTHPSLLPAFRGAHAVREALAHGVKLTGSTVHLVDELVDHGPIVAQRAVEVRSDDTEASLHARIKAVEHELLPSCVKLLCQGRLSVEDRHVRVREESA